MIGRSGEIFFVASDHGVDVSSFPLEESNLSFKVLDLFGQELDKVF
jgi:hypothetical protein